MITEIVAAIAISAKNTPHAIFLLLEILIFLIFYMNNKHEILPLKDTELIIKISNIYW